MTTPHRLPCSSFQLFRSSCPRFWFVGDRFKNIDKGRPIDTTYLDTQQMLHSLKNSYCSALNDRNSIGRSMCKEWGNGFIGSGSIVVLITSADGKCSKKDFFFEGPKIWFTFQSHAITPEHLHSRVIKVQTEQFQILPHSKVHTGQPGSLEPRSSW